MIGQVLDTYGHPERAARWLTTGLVRYARLPDRVTAADLGDDPDVRAMADERRRARHHAGPAPDHLDTLVGAVGGVPDDAIATDA